MDEPTNRIDSIRAAATLASSTRVRSFASIAISLVVLPVAGWIAGKLDTKLEVDALVMQNGVFAGKIAALESQRDDMKKQIDALSAPVVAGNSPGGPITQLQAQARAAQRTALRAYAVGLAFDRDKAKKRNAATAFADAYQNKLNDGATPADAAEYTITNVALP